MSLEPNENLRLRSDYPDYSKPIGDGVAQALQDYASAHRLTMENILLRQQLAEKDAEITRLHFEQEQYGPDKLAIQKQAWVEADRQRQINEFRQQLSEKDAEIAHWKNNHATEVRRARILKERTDIPIERVQAYERWCLDLAENAALRQQLSDKDAEIKQLLEYPYANEALEAMIAKAGEVMRKRAAEKAIELGDYMSVGKHVAGAIRALPGVTLEDLK